MKLRHAAALALVMVLQPTVTVMGVVGVALLNEEPLLGPGRQWFVVVIGCTVLIITLTYIMRVLRGENWK